MALEALAAAVYTTLTGDTGAGGVATLTGGRIYESHGPQDAALPLVEFSFVAGALLDSFSGTSAVIQAELQVDSYGQLILGAEPMRTLGDAIKAKLHRASLTATGYTKFQLLMTDPGVVTREGEGMRLTQRYRYWAA
jgi:hypothetical protein